MNRVLFPLLIAHVVAVLIAGIAMYFYVQNSRSNAAKAEAQRAAASSPAEAAPVDMSKVIRTAGVRVHNALGLTSVNNITLTTDVEDATLWLNDKQIGELPVHNVVTDNARPLVLCVRAEGYEPVELQITQTGRVSLRVGLDKVEERSAAPSAQRSRPRVVRDTPPPAAAPKPASSSSKRRSGDYFDNPF